MREYIASPLKIDGRQIPYPITGAADYFIHCLGWDQEQYEAFASEHYECVQKITQVIALKQACYLLRHTTHSCQSLPDSLLSLKAELLKELKEVYNFSLDEDWMETLV